MKLLTSGRPAPAAPRAMRELDDVGADLKGAGAGSLTGRNAAAGHNDPAVEPKGRAKSYEAVPMAAHLQPRRLST